MISDRFIQYFRENFFEGKEEEFHTFLTSLEKPIHKTIRIKPDRVEKVRNRLESDGYILTETNISNGFEIERSENFGAYERRLGYNIDHLVGNFYIQELAAMHPVDILSGGKIHTDEFLILDMASSPGGKTTQLAEMYPNSFIIANEPTRERIPQLLQNLDRMGSMNIGVTLYPGQFFGGEAEVFDRILLDAPCSGEGTAFRGSDVLKNWHIKNVRQIARLQEKLLESALIALKIDGEMIYSTCTLNLIENEGVLKNMLEKYPGSFEITFQKKWWPHIDGTGGFFVSKLRKIKAIETKERTLEPKYNEEIVVLKELHHLPESFRSNTTPPKYWKFRENILSTIEHPRLEEIRKKYYFMRWGENIGNCVGGNSLGYYAGRDMDIENYPKVELSDEETLDAYLRGSPDIPCEHDGTILLYFHDVILGLDRGRKGVIENIFPRDWRRK